MRIQSSFSLFILFLIASCSPLKKLNQTKEIKSITFLNEYTVPFNYQFQNTTVGGLSGIDYDFKNGVYYMICDDRSDHNPARFYTAKINIEYPRIDTVIFTKTTFLRDNLGKNYPNSRQNARQVPDPEAMRFNAKMKNFIWSSEGERIVDKERVILLDPAITEINKDGHYIDTFQLPENFQMQETENGPRRNGVFEGITFSGDYKYLFVSTEEPLYEDGPRAGLNDSSGLTRMIKYDVASKKPIGQYAYKIEPVAHAPIPTDGFKVNGISDILWLHDEELLVIERSYSVGRFSNTIKVFIASLEGADNIQDKTSLKNEPSFKPMSKRLLLNMDDLKMFIDNIEGVTFGPLLKNGKKSLVFVSDNNFSQLQKTQFLLFQINE